MIDERLGQLTKEQVATFIYTSGTTGPPKAVMLTHENLASDRWRSHGLGPADPRRQFAVLPPALPHCGADVQHPRPISVGSKVYFAESIDDVPENLKEAADGVLGVPRIWEKFYSAVNAGWPVPRVKAKLVSFAMKNATKVAELRNKAATRASSRMLATRLARSWCSTR